MQCAHRRQHFRCVALRPHGGKHARDVTASIDDERHASRIAAGCVDAERRSESTGGVGDERKRQSVLRGKGPMRREVVHADTEQRDACFVRERAFVTERFDFADSTRCGVSRIEEHDEHVSPRARRDIDHAAIVRDGVKRRDGIADAQQCGAGG